MIKVAARSAPPLSRAFLTDSTGLITRTCVCVYVCVHAYVYVCVYVCTGLITRTVVRLPACFSYPST